MENKKVITRSLIVLFLSLSVIYSLTYQKEKSLFKTSIKSGNETTYQAPIQNQNSGSITQNTQNSVNDVENTKNTQTTNSISSGNTKPSGVNNSNTQTPNKTTNSNSNNVKKLPGTTEYFGTLDIVGILGEKPKYTLQDSKGNYFAYYGNHLNFVETVKTLGGNVYEMVTESEIIQNQLFGDRVSYINLSMFKDVRVLMVIEIDDDVRLLQIPADKYHHSKDYLKSLFVK